MKRKGAANPLSTDDVDFDHGKSRACVCHCGRQHETLRVVCQSLGEYPGRPDKSLRCTLAEGHANDCYSMFDFVNYARWSQITEKPPKEKQ